jgi:hypothetical protein
MAFVCEEAGEVVSPEPIVQLNDPQRAVSGIAGQNSPFKQGSR